MLRYTDEASRCRPFSHLSETTLWQTVDLERQTDDPRPAYRQYFAILKQKTDQYKIQFYNCWISANENGCQQCLTTYLSTCAFFGEL